MLGAAILLHGQLHEVLFRFLEDDDLFNCRLWHGAGAATLAEYAKVQLKDVLGYEGTSMASDAPVIPTALVRLLMAVDEFTALLSSTIVRSFSVKQYLGPEKQRIAVVSALKRSILKSSQLDLCTLDFDEMEADDNFLRTLEPYCSRLETLHLHGTNATGPTIYALVRRSRALKSLDIRRCLKVEHSLIDIVGCSSNLDSLLLGAFSFDLSPSDPCDRFTTMLTQNCGAKLKTFGPGDTYFWDGAEDEVQLLARSCRSLTNLDLSGIRNMMRSDIVELFLREKPLLVSLDLQQSSVSNFGLLAVSEGSPELRRFAVQGSFSTVDDDGIASVFQNCKKLQSVCVRAVPRVSDRSILELAVHCPHLEKLDCMRNEHITDASLIQVLICCKKLRALLCGSCRVTDELFVKGFPADRTSLSLLEELDIRKTGVTDAGILRIASACRRLRVAHIDKLPITDVAIDALATQLPGLRELSLGDVKIVTDGAMIRLVSRCVKLEELDISRTNLGSDFIFALGEHCRRLSRLSWREVRVDEKALLQLAANCRLLLHLDITSRFPGNGQNISNEALKALRSQGIILH